MALGELLVDEGGTITGVKVLPATAEERTTKFVFLPREDAWNNIVLTGHMPKLSERTAVSTVQAMEL